jgi:hypothetical protein
MILKSIQPIRAVRFLGMALSVCLAVIGLHAESAPAPTTESKASRFAIGAEAGTVGFGPVLVVTASKHFTLDVGYTWLNYDYDYSDAGGDYKTKLKLSNFQAIANWHPFAGTFHLSAGAFVTENKMDMTGVPKAGNIYEIGDASYTAAQVGTLTGTTEISSGVAPFLGLGWTKVPTKSGFGFFFEVGVLFINAPTVKLAATGGTLSNDPAFKSNLHKEEQTINDDVSSFQYYPVAQLGLIYRF